jgi:hypothetical protein
MELSTKVSVVLMRQEERLLLFFAAKRRDSDFAFACKILPAFLESDFETIKNEMELQRVQHAKKN